MFQGLDASKWVDREVEEEIKQRKLPVSYPYVHHHSCQPPPIFHTHHTHFILYLQPYSHLPSWPTPHFPCTCDHLAWEWPTSFQFAPKPLLCPCHCPLSPSSTSFLPHLATTFNLFLSYSPHTHHTHLHPHISFFQYPLTHVQSITSFTTSPTLLLFYFFPLPMHMKSYCAWPPFSSLTPTSSSHHIHLYFY